MQLLPWRLIQNMMLKEINRILLKCKGILLNNHD